MKVLPAIASGMERSIHKKVATQHDWRCYGEIHRQKLVEQDEANTSFYLPSCSIARYFELAERVVNQFRSQCSDLQSASPSSLEDAYVMGHRLIAFLSLALPQHPDYLNVSVSSNRNKTFRDLVWINERMDDIALKIDEEQLNNYISLEFDPNPDDHDDDDDDDDDDSDVVDEKAVEVNAKSSPSVVKQSNCSLIDVHSQSSWETFPSWNLDAFDVPNATDTDSSSFESELNNTTRDASDSERDDNATDTLPSSIMSMEKTQKKDKKHVKFQLDEEELTMDKATKELECAVNHDHQSTVYYIAEEGYQDPVLMEEYDSQYSFRDALQVSEFLRKIADEDVRYENDSEANDSWAQDGEQSASDDSGDSAGSTLTCDPARIAFREIMNKASNSSRRGAVCDDARGPAIDDDQWASFTFASVRQSLI